MSEYIIEWSGIGARIVELIGSVPACLIPKRLREERLREEIVRCRDCRYGINGGELCAEGASDSWDWRNVEPDGFCAWGERKEGGE